MPRPARLADPGVGTVRRYVAVGGDGDGPRYMNLPHGLLASDPAQQGRFSADLRRDARTISDEELTFLLQPGRLGNWRNRLVAAYLIAVDRRMAFRETIGGLLLASETTHSGEGYCFALAAFGGGRDGEILVAYLDRYLPHVGLRYDQDWAMGALLYLDLQRNTTDAERYSGSGSAMWTRWASGASHPVDAKLLRNRIARLCAL